MYLVTARVLHSSGFGAPQVRPGEIRLLRRENHLQPALMVLPRKGRKDIRSGVRVVVERGEKSDHLVRR